MAKLLKTNKASNRKTPIYVWSTPTNRKFVRKEAQRRGYNSASEFVDSLIQRERDRKAS